MGSQQSTPNNAKVEATPKKEQEQKDETKKLKPCCACPETREIRDMCIMEKGQENCSNEIEDHKECMRKLGFKI